MAGERPTGEVPIAGKRPAGRHVTLDAHAGPLRASLAEAWRFRGLSYRFAARDITLRYRQTSIGISWVVLQPLIAAGAFTIVFGKVAKLPSDGVSYLPFALSGLVFWTAFSSTIVKATGSLINNASLVSKVYFPRMVLPVSAVGAVLLDVLVGLLLLAAVMAVTGTPTTIFVLLLPVLLVGIIALAIGVGLLGAALSARYRDIVYILAAGLQAMLYVSPVGYGLSAVPHGLRPFYTFNPLSGFLEAARWAILGTASPSVGTMLYSGVLTVLVLFTGLFVFHRKQTEFADVL